MFFNLETSKAVYGIAKIERKHLTNNYEKRYIFTHNDNIDGTTVSREEILNNFFEFAKKLKSLESSVDSPKREIAYTPNNNTDIIHGNMYDLDKFLNN